MKSIFINISIYKTIRFNLKYFKLRQALIFPVLVSRHTKLNNLKGKITLNCKIKTGLILIGFGNVPVFDRVKSRSVWNFGAGEMIINGKCVFGHGSKIGCGGTIIFGKNFAVTAETTIICNKLIEFGDNVLISWHCQIMDTDFHKILMKNEQVNQDRSISIGNHVWIGSHVIINKGTRIPSECIIASGAVVSKEFFEKNTIIGGMPARVLKSGVEWSI